MTDPDDLLPKIDAPEIAQRPAQALAAENAELRKLLVILCVAAKPFAETGHKIIKLRLENKARAIAGQTPKKIAVDAVTTGDWVGIAAAVSNVLGAAPK